MRNLKKILALALALVMSLSLMATANAFTDDDSINDTYETAVTVLSGLKVFQGYDDGSFLPQGAITRAEVAAIIYRIVTGDVADTQVGIYADYNKFDDVASTSWYAGYVNFCANAEYIKGYDARTFGPNDPVTGYQALAMILRALGYDKNGEFTGTNWTIQTAAVGEQRGITKNITAGTLNVPATREVVAEILFRAILVNKVNYTPAFGYQLNDTSLGYETFGLEEITGVVVANEYATAYGSGEGALDEGKTKIEVVSEDDGGNGLGADGTYDVSTPVDMLGKQVTMFIKYKNANSLSDKDAVVYGSPIVSGKNNIVTVTDGSYVENHGTTKGLLYKNDLTVDYDKVTVLKNYEAQTIVAGSERINDTLNQIQGGTLTLIDNDNDDEVEYVIYTEYTAGVVTNYSTSGDGSIKVTGIDKYDDAADVVGFDDVAKGDFVLAIEYGGKLYV